MSRAKRDQLQVRAIRSRDAVETAIEITKGDTGSTWEALAERAAHRIAKWGAVQPEPAEPPTPACRR